jgi:glycosyltransferase involved in cell wall biosynthesis
MRIVHVDTGVHLRGGQLQLLMLARGLRNRGHHQAIVCLEGSALERKARREGFPIIDLPTHDPMHAHGVIQFRQRLLAQKTDVLHAHGGTGQSIAWFASLGMRTRLRRVASRRVTFSPAHAWTTRLKYGRACDGVVAVSQNIKKLLLDARVPEEKIEVIPDGVRVPSVLPGPEIRARVRAAWGFGEGDFVTGHMGAFTTEKGQDIAIKAIAALRPKLPRACLVLAGWPGEDNAFARNVRDLARGAAGSVRLLGYTENLEEF